jgi:hypothetical protein
MLDANLVVEDVEELLNNHYSQLRAQGIKQLQPRVRVYDAPPQPSVSKQPPARSSASPLNELVANLFVLLMLSVVNQGLSNQPAR